MNKLSFRYWVATALLLLSPTAFPGQDEDLLAAREAVRTGNRTGLDVHAARLAGHPLESYAIYWQLRLRLKEADPETIRGFLTRYPDTYLADRLRGEWLKELAYQQRWDLFSQEYRKTAEEDTELACHALQARLRAGEPAVLEQARPLWFTARELPESCKPLMQALLARSSLRTEDVWARWRLAAEAGQLTVAKQVAEALPPGQAPASRSMDRLAENPERYLHQGVLELHSRAGRELLILAVQRLARSNAVAAARYWSKAGGRLSAEERRHGWGLIAYHGALQQHPEALEWFREAGDQLNDRQLGWKVRAALRAGNWKEVLAAVEALSEREAKEPAWRYWKARALKAEGRLVEANALLAPLSAENHFYGQLASEELGRVVSAASPAPANDAEAVQRMFEVPAIQRALALYRLNLRFEGGREWAWATRNASDRELLAAAEVASRHGLYDRAIATANRTLQLHDFGLRFPTPFREAVRETARQFDLDEAWLYGLIHQESRFVPTIRSRAGAAGLMQLMPATAKWVSKRIGWTDYRPSLLDEYQSNLALGGYYLKYVLEILDRQPVPASAAYNAGPGRARRWLGDSNMEGAIYAETIPITETRDYVKRVMSNATYYAVQFGSRIASLKERLGVIPARDATKEE